MTGRTMKQEKQAYQAQRKKEIGANAKLEGNTKEKWNGIKDQLIGICMIRGKLFRNQLLNREKRG